MNINELRVWLQEQVNQCNHRAETAYGNDECMFFDGKREAFENVLSKLNTMHPIAHKQKFVAPLYYCPNVPPDTPLRMLSSEVFDRMIEICETETQPNEALRELMARPSLKVAKCKNSK